MYIENNTIQYYIIIVNISLNYILKSKCVIHKKLINVHKCSKFVCKTRTILEV